VTAQSASHLIRTISFDRAVDNYDATRSLPPKVMAEVVKGLSAALERRGCRRILDVGVGTGMFACPLQDLRFHVIGVDVSVEMLKRARSKSVGSLAQGDARRLPFKDKAFDAVLMNHVLHLIREWREALREIRRVARSALFSVTAVFPEIDSPQKAYEERLLKTGWPAIHPGMHERDLVNVIPPSESTFIVTNSDEKAADDLLERLEKRSYSFMWDVPEEVHREIMAGLRADYAGKRVKSSRDLYISIWNVRQF